MSANYVIGSQARTSVTFTDMSGAPADPTAVTVHIKTPASAETAYVFGASAIVKDSTGNYHFDFPLTLAGNWYYRWVGTGAVIAATPDGLINVPKTVFASP